MRIQEAGVTMEGYTGLKVYKKAFDLVVGVYESVKTLPKEELFGLSSQMRRAAVSVPLNIAEGYGRKANPKDYRQFLNMAKGSCNEMQVLVDLCLSLGYMHKEQHAFLRNGYDEVGKMLYGIISTLQ